MCTCVSTFIKIPRPGLCMSVYIYPWTRSLSTYVYDVLVLRTSAAGEYSSSPGISVAPGHSCCPGAPTPSV